MVQLYADYLPSQVRDFISKGVVKGSTAGYCKDYVQMNVLIMPKAYASDFEIYASLNRQACPVLEIIPEGSFMVEKMARHVDIRDTVPSYDIYRYGVKIGSETDIRDYWQDDFVTFLIGCSFTFENALMNEGISIRHIEEEVNVPMYISHIPTTPHGPFHGNLVVSMRPVADALVEKAVHITSQYPDVHGAPIHIGNPLDIGISELSKPDFGDAVTLRSGEVPVFWACGVTSQIAARAAKLPIMMTHSPGHMFIGDIKNQSLESPPSKIAANLERLLSTHLDTRGLMKALPLTEGSLLKTALSMAGAKTIGIVTGFYIQSCHAGETDGPLGALALAHALEQLDKQVYLFTDKHSSPYLKSGCAQLNLKALVIEDAEDYEEGAFYRAFPMEHLIAIERPGKNSHDGYFSMSANEMTHDVPDYDRFFIAARNQGIPTSAIGDGGNEIGMGNIYDYVKARVPFGEIIASKTCVDYLILAGISNWGGHALSVLLSVMHQKKLPYAIECERELLSRMIAQGAVDGVTKQCSMSVDGVNVDDYLEPISQMIALLDFF